MDFEKYENKLEYLDYSAEPVKPRFKGNFTDEQIKRLITDIKTYEQNMIIHTEKLMEWRKEENRLREQFKQDAFKELEIENHPKRDLLYSLACRKELDDDDDLSDIWSVWSEMQELVELMR